MLADILGIHVFKVKAHDGAVLAEVKAVKLQKKRIVNVDLSSNKTESEKTKKTTSKEIPLGKK